MRPTAPNPEPSHFRPNIQKGDILQFLTDRFNKDKAGRYFLVLENIEWNGSNVDFNLGWNLELYDLAARHLTTGVWTVLHGHEDWTILRE